MCNDKRNISDTTNTTYITHALTEERNNCLPSYNCLLVISLSLSLCVFAAGLTTFLINPINHLTDLIMSRMQKWLQGQCDTTISGKTSHTYSFQLALIAAFFLFLFSHLLCWFYSLLQRIPETTLKTIWCRIDLLWILTPKLLVSFTNNYSIFIVKPTSIILIYNFKKIWGNTLALKEKPLHY